MLYFSGIQMNLEANIKPKFRLKPILLFVVNVDWFFLSHRLPIAIAAQKHGYEVHIAVGITDQDDRLKAHGLIVHPLRLERGETNPLLVLRTFFDILAICRTVDPDIIHFVTIKPIILGGIACHFFKRKCLVFSVSGLGYIFSSNGIKARARRIITAFLYRLALTHKNIKVIFQNNHDLQTIRRPAKLRPCQTIIVPGSGVDLSNYAPLAMPAGPPIILFAARLLSSKGIYDFIEASYLVPDARFVVAGQFDSENRECLKPQELERSVQSGYIEYWGFSDNVADLINQSSIVVLPSYYGEGLPKVLIEAAACGRPVITTDHPGCRDAIEPGITGLLVPVRDPIALANAIQNLINDPDRRISMGLAGRALAERKFDVKEVVQTHLDIYAELIAENL